MNINILNNDMIAAMKAKDNVTRDVLRSIIANIKKAAIDERCEITDELCDKVITKELKTVNEMIDTCPADRTETLAVYNAKKAVVLKYAPTIIDNEDEIRKMVLDIIAEAGITDKNQVMKTVMPRLKGKVDMKVANQVIRTIEI